MSEFRLYRPDACTGCVKAIQKGNENGDCQDERTMLPGLSTTINSRSLLWRRIFTGFDVTGGSCRWTTFLRQGNSVGQDRIIEENLTHSTRSPSTRTVSGFATFPLTVVTPDSSAYLYGPFSNWNKIWRFQKIDAHNIPSTYPWTLWTQLLEFPFQSNASSSSWYMDTNTEVSSWGHSPP